MGLTAWAQEQQAKHEAWREIDELKRQNAALVAERDALAAHIEVLHSFIESVMANIGAGATLDEVCDMLCDWWDSPKQTPQQCLNEIRAEAGRAGFVAGTKCCADYLDTYYADIDFSKHADQYAGKVRNGE